MDLDEYIWMKRLKSIDIARKADFSPNALCKMRKKKGSPSLLAAIKLCILSEGEITMEELLSERDAELFKIWSSHINGEQV